MNEFSSFHLSAKDLRKYTFPMFSGREKSKGTVLTKLVLCCSDCSPGQCAKCFPKWKSLSCFWLFVTAWTVARQASLSLESSGKNTGMSSHSLLQGIVMMQGSIPDLPHCRHILYHLNHQGSPAFQTSFHLILPSTLRGRHIFVYILQVR